MSLKEISEEMVKLVKRKKDVKQSNNVAVEVKFGKQYGTVMLGGSMGEVDTKRIEEKIVAIGDIIRSNEGVALTKENDEAIMKVITSKTK